MTVQAVWIREPHGDEHTWPQCGQECRAAPQKQLRTGLSSLDDVLAFGPWKDVEVARKAFSQASHCSFVADGQKCNWIDWKRHLSTFTPAVDLRHAIRGINHAAVPIGGEEDFNWASA